MYRLLLVVLVGLWKQWLSSTLQLLRVKHNLHRVLSISYVLLPCGNIHMLSTSSDSCAIPTHQPTYHVSISSFLYISAYRLKCFHLPYHPVSMQSSDSNAIELSMLEICPKIAKVAVTAEPTGVLNSVDQSTFYDDNSSQESEHGEEQLAHNVADKPLPEKPLPAKPLPLPPGETEAEPEYPTGPKLILISFALCLAVFLVTLVSSWTIV